MATSSLHWARLKAEGPYPLRRGAWYRVTKFASTEVLLDVNRLPVIVPRSAVELVGTPPRHWTVVVRPANAVRLPQSWGDRYLVCPSCRARAPVPGAPILRCPRCNSLFPVAWDEKYLGRN
jgi:uncharacterized C2H2 Zn-finger protein